MRLSRSFFVAYFDTSVDLTNKHVTYFEFPAARVVYEESDFVSARRALSSRGVPIEACQTSFARSAASLGLSEKSGASAVSEGLAAVGCRIWEVAHSPLGTFTAAHWVEASSWAFDCVLECENLEGFMRLHEYTWLNKYLLWRSTLAVFCGGPHPFGQARPLPSSRELSNPSWSSTTSIPPVCA